jgi:hypothetical protein
MKTFKKRIIISAKGEILTNHEYSKIKRVVEMLQFNDMDVILKDMIVEDSIKKSA